MKSLDPLACLTALSIAIAFSSIGCNQDRNSVFEPDPPADDAGHDASVLPDGAGVLVDAGNGDGDAGFDADAGDPDAAVDAAEDGDVSDPTPDAGDGDSEAGSGDGGAGCASDDDCDDGIACTLDACEDGVCVHRLGSGSGASACPVGQYCDPNQGCVPGHVCATDAQCEEKLGDDPCKVHIYCHKPTATCQYSILDRDGDGHPPVSCGGRDCNDTDPYVHPGEPELCDGKDNDCNGVVDDGDVCELECKISECRDPEYPDWLKCCAGNGKCGWKSGPTGYCYELEEENDTCGISTCPDPDYADFFKCCTEAATCGFKNGPSGYCYESDPGGGGSGGGMP